MQRLFFTQTGNRVIQFLKQQAAFRRLPADVDLKQNILPDAVLCPLP